MMLKTSTYITSKVHNFQIFIARSPIKHMKMGTSRRPFICFSLLLLMLQFEALSSPVKVSAPSPNQFAASGFEWHKDDDGDKDVFVDSKRKIKTGSNPLHNR
ncbi:unnamed protein product [Lactuca saligna]|uniref:Uncharacterized protein n=1 Tax=Lactuca saligna TaxID=75948 RepID=A0AA36EHN5_LACSI|nr:unnamed protein product [Lactuca saligna]